MIMEGWKTTLKEFTNASVWEIGGDNIPETSNIILCMDQRIKNIPEDVMKMIGVLIIDEAHLFCTRSHIEPLMMFNPRYVLALTATMKRPDGFHSIMDAIIGDSKIVIPNPDPFVVIKYNTKISGERKMSYNGKFRREVLNWGVLSESLLSNKFRNNMILTLIEKNPQKKILVLSTRKSHIDFLHKSLEFKSLKCDFIMGNKKTYIDTPILLGTISKIGTGFDEALSALDYKGVRINLLILVMSVKSVGSLEQCIGRVRRCREPCCIHFVDNDPTIQSHWKGAEKWYKSQGADIKEVTTTLSVS